MYRNLTMFRFPTMPALTEAAVTDCKLKPVGPLDLLSQGFVSPLGEQYEDLVHVVGDCVEITVGTESRVLPASAVNKAVSDRIKAAEAKLGMKISGRQHKAYKEEVLHDMIPRAFVRPGRTSAYMDPKLGVLFVDTGSRKQAEAVASEIRHALGSFPALPLNAEVSPRSLMTGWLAGEPLPELLSLGDEFTLKSASTGGGVLHCNGLDIASDEIALLLETGKQVTRIALVFDDHISFTLDEDLILRKVKFLDSAMVALDGEERDTMRQELGARFALLTAELGRLFPVLAAALFLTPPEGVKPAAPAADIGQARRKRRMAGIESVTISGGGMEPITMSMETFTEVVHGDVPDPLYSAAVLIVTETRRASISGVQRRLKIGYNRAACLIEAMEAAGIVTPPEHNGDRTVLAPAAVTAP